MFFAVAPGDSVAMLSDPLGDEERILVTSAYTWLADSELRETTPVT